MDIATFLAEIRSDLQDTAQQPRWSDDTLFIYIKDAIYDYSEYFPRIVGPVELSPGSGQNEYELPNDFVKVYSVESPRDTFLEPRHVRPGLTYRKTHKPRYYYVSGGSLFLSGSPSTSDGVYLNYLSHHLIPVSVDDDEFEFSIPDRDLELIRLYVKAKAHEQMRAKQSRLDRFDIGSGRRDDNPLTPEVKSFYQEYLNKIHSRIEGGAIKLYRSGRLR